MLIIFQIIFIVQLFKTYLNLIGKHYSQQKASQDGMCVLNIAAIS